MLFSPWPVGVALLVAGGLCGLLRWWRPSGRWGGGVLALAAAAGLVAHGGSWALAAWWGLGGSAVALLAGRGRGVAIAAAGLWAVGGLSLVAGPFLARQGPLQGGLVLVALAVLGSAGAAAQVRAPAPGRGAVLAGAALVVALAMLLPGSSLRLGGQGLIVAGAALPLAWAPHTEEDDGLAAVGAGMIALGAMSSALLASLGAEGLALLALLALPALRSPSPRRTIAAQTALLAAVCFATLARDLWALATEGVPL